MSILKCIEKGMLRVLCNILGSQRLTGTSAPSEMEIMAAFHQILGQPEIETTNKFWQAGGTSLMAMQFSVLVSISLLVLKQSAQQYVFGQRSKHTFTTGGRMIWDDAFWESESSSTSKNKTEDQIQLLKFNLCVIPGQHLLFKPSILLNYCCRHMTYTRPTLPY